MDVALPRDWRSPREARRRVAAELTRCGFPDEAVADAALLVSELVTNALMHGAGEMQLTCSVDGDVARIGVSDGNLQLPLLEHRDPESIGGRGMQVVDTVAARWGVDTESSGKTVWFEIAH